MENIIYERPIITKCDGSVTCPEHEKDGGSRSHSFKWTRVIYSGILTRKPLEKGEFQFVYLHSLLINKIFIRKENDLQTVFEIFKSLVLNGNLKWPILLVFFFQIEIKKVLHIEIVY